MNVAYFLAKTTDPQIPNANLSVLTSRDAQLIVFESHILHSVMTLQSSHRFDDIRGQNRPQLSFNGSTFDIKQLEFIGRG